MSIYLRVFVSTLCRQKLTAIVSLDRGHCFVLPLNTTFVTPLREFYQLAKNIEVCLFIVSSVYVVILLFIFHQVRYYYRYPVHLFVTLLYCNNIV